jgi:secreted trypsin-like serine protease
VQAPHWCRTSAPPFYARMEMCAVDPPAYATGGCSGDSGGPLMATDPSNGEPVQIGILIHGYRHCSPRRPTVYTRVDAIASWASSWIRAYALPPAPAPGTAPPPGNPPAPAAG